MVPLQEFRPLWSETVTCLLQKVVTFRRALVSLRLFVLITREPSAGASISTCVGPQMAETCFCGQKTLSLRKETESSQGLM